MKNITQRAIRIYAVLEDFRDGSEDILTAIMPFFEPLLAERNGKMLDAHEFAGAVRLAYAWNFTADVVEELSPRFESKGWLKAITSGTNNVSYLVNCDNQAALPPHSSEVAIVQRLSSVVDEFLDFIKEISPLTISTKSTDDWCDTLVEWLVSIDAYNEDVLRQQQIVPNNINGTIGISIVQSDASRVSSEDRYLCARFAKHLFDTKSPYISDLCKIASVGLLTEVVQDFQKPLSQVTKSDLCVYLDAPVALDLLGVSGSASAENTRIIIKQLQDIGASVRIFEISVEELLRALKAVIARNPAERTGPTADALRRNQTTEAYIRAVIADPNKYLAHYGVGITDRKIDQYPNQDQYFTRQHYNDCYGAIKFQMEDKPRVHDASVIAFIMRMRAGNSRPDLFGNRFIMVTKNGALSQLSRRFCLEAGVLPKRTYPPVIHQRQLATALWLRTGFSNGQESEIPKRFLLAACERVLELKKAVVEQVRIVGRTMTQEKAEQLDLLLTQDRSAEILMDRTLGVSHVITPTNIEGLVDAMRQGLAEEITEEADTKIKDAQKAANAKVRAATEARHHAEREAKQYQEALERLTSEDAEAIDALFKFVNKKVQNRVRIIKIGAGLIILLVGAMPILIEGLDSYLKFIVLSLSGIIGASFAYFQMFDRQVGLESYARRWGTKILEETAKSRGLTKKLAATAWSWDKTFFRYASQTKKTLL